MASEPRIVLGLVAVLVTHEDPGHLAGYVVHLRELEVVQVRARVHDVYRDAVAYTRVKLVAVVVGVKGESLLLRDKDEVVWRIRLVPEASARIIARVVAGARDRGDVGCVLEEALTLGLGERQFPKVDAQNLARRGKDLGGVAACKLE